MSTDPASLPWRTGRHFPRHMYAQIGEEPSDADPYVGTLETAELAALACVAHNDLLIRGELEAKARAGQRERKDASEWFALQQRLPDADWEDCLSLGGWGDPGKRAAALKDFRQSEESLPGTWYRMVRHTETVLDE